ncbi:MAG: hypothetical protein EXR72_13100 [Myxococcales bacterium]|nr:hypothetical protein [Myxococcales bacterium]
MKTLLVAGVALAAFAAALVYLRSDRPVEQGVTSERPARPATAMGTGTATATTTTTGTGTGTASAVDVADSDPLQLPQPVKLPPPSPAEMEALATKLEQAADEPHREMAMHDYVSASARLDFVGQRQAHYRLEEIERRHAGPADAGAR